jgi:Ca2+-binding EF-hand superfamily protein
VESAKAVARRLFDTYDKDRNGQLDQVEGTKHIVNLVAPMMVDAYRGMSKGFNPSKSDVETYSRILDKNGDGRVTLADLEALAIKYLVGSYQESPKRTIKRQYSKMVEERLDVARRLFRKFDHDGSGYITEDEVVHSLKLKGWPPTG